MPHIYITIGEFDRNSRSYPITVKFAGRTSSRRLTKDQARGLWQSKDRSISDTDLSMLLFRALLEGLEAQWNSAKPSLLQGLSVDPSGGPSAIRIFLEIADLELNELPWELAANNFDPNCQIIRISKSPVTSMTQALQLPIEAIVIEGREPAGVPFPDELFRLDDALRQIFGPHADISSVFRETRLTGASSEDFTSIVGGRRFDIVHLATRADWQAVSDTTESEGVLRLAGSAPPLNGAACSSLLAAAQTRLLVLHIPTAAPAAIPPPGPTPVQTAYPDPYSAPVPVSHEDAESLPAILDLAARIRTLSGPAVLVVQAQPLSVVGVAKSFLYLIYDAIVHDTPLDIAVFRGRLQFPQVQVALFLPADGEDILRVSPLASALAASVKEKREALLSLQSRAQALLLPPDEQVVLQKSIDDGLALLQSADAGVAGISTWIHESGGILPLRQAIANAEEASLTFQLAAKKMNLVERSAQRVVNTHFQGDDGAIPSSHSLLPDAEYRFCLDIGPPSEISNVVDAKPIPETYLQSFYDETGVDLRVCLFSEQFRIANDSLILRLPRSGRTKPLEFTVLTPVKPGPARLRACVYHSQNLLQSILVTAQITATVQTDLKDGNIAEVEFSLSDRLQPDDLPERTLNILLNENLDGTHTFAVLGANVKKQFSIDQGNEAKLARQKLLDICSTRDKKGNLRYLYSDDNNSGDEAKLIRDLKELAYWGWKLYCHFAMEPLDDDFETKLEATLQGPSTIQIASTRSARYVYPWAAVYDKPFVRSPNSIVCSEALKLLRTGGSSGFLENISCPQNGCPQAADTNVVCPLRFWGFKHSIEQPANSGEIVREIPMASDPKCVMGAHSLLSGAQHCQEIERECYLTADYGETKNDIGKSLASTKPHLVYFYCHGGSTSGAPWLGVGKDEHIDSSDLKAWKVKWPETRPLVIINGCDTVDLNPDDLLDFVTTFAWTRASGIIGTEISIPESLAREFGREFLRQFLTGSTVRDVMHRVRIRLLEKYNLLGLAYTPYCYGDLHVARVPSPS
jgi:hypothetical protein